MPEIIGKVRGLSLFYRDNVERNEIYIDKKYQEFLPALNNKRVPINLIFGVLSYNAGLRMTPKCPYLWICANLELQGEKIRLVDVFKQQGIRKNDTLKIYISGNNFTCSNPQ